MFNIHNLISHLISIALLHYDTMVEPILWDKPLILPTWKSMVALLGHHKVGSQLMKTGYSGCVSVVSLQSLGHNVEPVCF